MVKSGRSKVYLGVMGHRGCLREETPANRATHVVGCTCIDRPPPPRSLEIERNPFLSAIAHWKDVRHRHSLAKSTHNSTYYMRNIQTDRREHNYCSCLANNLPWYTYCVSGQSVNALAPSLPHYEGVIVAHRQRTFPCAQIHLKGTFEGY